MSKEDMIELQGVVTEMLPESRFRVLLDNGVEILAYGSGKMRMHRIRVLMGDTDRANGFGSAGSRSRPMAW